jgi:preprotein translocase subunit SecE
MLTGSVEDEILRDQKEAERTSTLLKEESRSFRQWVARISARRLLLSVLTLTIGFVLLLYGLSQSLSLGNIEFAQTYSSVDTPLLIDILLMIVGFALIIGGLNFGIKGVISGASPRGENTPATAPSPQGFSTASNLSVRAAYEGQFVPKEQQAENKQSD